MKRITSLFLVLSLLLQSAWAGGITDCYNFDDQNGIPVPSFKFQRKKKAPVKKSSDICMPDLKKEAEKLDDKIRKLKKSHRESAAQLADKYENIHKDNEHEKNALRKSRDKRRKKLKFGKDCKSKKKGFQICLKRDYVKSQEQRLSLNNEIDNIETQEDEDFSLEFGRIYEKIFDDFVKEKGLIPDESRPGFYTDPKGNLKAFDKEQDQIIQKEAKVWGDAKESERAAKERAIQEGRLRDNLSENLGVLDANQNGQDGFLSDYEIHHAINSASAGSYVLKALKKMDPAFLERQEELDKMIEKKKDLLAKAKELCSGKGLYGCPDAKAELEGVLKDPDSTPVKHEAAFEKLITTLGGFRYYDETGKKVQYAVVNLSNYDEYKKRINKSENKGQEEVIEGRVDRAKKALENYTANKDNAKKEKENLENIKKNGGGVIPKTDKFKVEPVNGACGGCGTLKQMYQKAAGESDSKLMAKILKLNDDIGCKSIAVVKGTCETALKAAVKDTKFDNKAGIKSLTDILDAYERAPDYTGEDLAKVYDKVTSTSVQDESGTPLNCGGCEDIVKRLEKMTVPSEEVGENEESYVKMKPEFAARKKEFKTLRDIAVAKQCVEPGDFTEVPGGSCSDITAPVVDVLNAAGSETIGFNWKPIIETAKEKLAAYKEKNKKDCCEDIMALASPIPKGSSTVIKNSNAFNVAQKLECAKCGDQRDLDADGTFKAVGNPGLSCEFYKNNILKHIRYDEYGNIDKHATQDVKVPGMKKSDNTDYYLNEYLENETYECAQGPKKSELRRGADWEAKEFSQYGKFGALEKFRMRCVVLPCDKSKEECRNSKGFEVQNVACCGMKEESQEFQDLQGLLNKEKDKVNSSQMSDLCKGAANPVACRQGIINSTVDSFCKDIKANVVKEDYEAKGKDWEVCTDYRGVTLFRVDDSFEVKGSSGSHSISVPSSGTNVKNE